MRTVVHTRPGEPAQVLTLREEPDRPCPGTGQVLVRMLVRPVHPGDLVGVEGPQEVQEQNAEPRTPGAEGMGVIESVGADVHSLRPGQRVAVFPAPGSWADFIVVPSGLAVPVPVEVSDETAALMLVNPLTLLMLHRAVDDALRGSKGPVLQTAAGSSIGRLISMAAVRHDLQLINLVRSASGAQRMRLLHPTLPVIATCDDDWQEQVRHLTGGHGAEVVLDCVGGAMTQDLAELLADGGTLISYGQLGAGTTALEELALVQRALTVRGVTVLHWMDRTPEERAQDIAFALDLARSSPDLFEVAADYDLADFKAAIEHARRPGKSGTVLITSPRATGSEHGAAL
ncbi:Phthiocerol synthesis polyketide synthase type I PpsC [Streptomyces sp. ADI97-07]|uniref:zinc-binding dehydrogenase n=1 Tax=Streptomyces sp. ADI97-07 TaxID=1522762 RepID=UPI000F54C6DE|nr:zinc-binding dehydrogenase [Streptomyces sp. ADI97-07]RPK83897.1 Phthiocerol synthesis polyketide synthase type I PpsC [Streptomyces sp. ADI97-07]